MESIDRARRVPCSVRCWRVGGPVELRAANGVYVCKECGAEWTLEELESWEAHAEATLAVMADSVESRTKWSEFLRLSREGAERAREFERTQRVMTLPEALELTISLLQNEPKMSDAVRLHAALRALDRLLTYIKSTTPTRGALRRWAEWRRGQCDYPDGINPEEQALLEIADSKD